MAPGLLGSLTDWLERLSWNEVNTFKMDFQTWSNPGSRLFGRLGLPTEHVGIASSIPWHQQFY